MITAVPGRVVAMMLADARLPSGGHVSSSGLEPALLGGLDVTEVAAFMAVRARTVAMVDAATAVVAAHDAARGQVRRSIHRAWAARTPGAAARDVAQNLGRGLVRLARALWPQAPLDQLGPMPPRPLVMGVIAHQAGLTGAELVDLMIYDDTAAAAAALLKLEPGDPAEAMALVLQTCAAVSREAAELITLTEPDEIPMANGPQAEAWTENHAQMTRRLFRA